MRNDEKRLSLASKTISDNWNPFINNENAFYFMLKTLFVLEIFTFLSWLFGYTEKRIDKKVMVTFKIFDVADCKTNNYSTQMIVYKKTDEWYIEWQRMTTSGTTNDNEWYNEWKRVTTSGTSDKKWYRKWTLMTTSNKKWQRMTASDKWMNTNESRYNGDFMIQKKQKANLVPE